MTDPRAIDFDAVEKLRKHLLLQTASFAELLGVSRATYYNWLRGSQPAEQRLLDLRRQLRILSAMVIEEGMPHGDYVHMDQKERAKLLHQRLLKD